MSSVVSQPKCRRMHLVPWLSSSERLRAQGCLRVDTKRARDMLYDKIKKIVREAKQEAKKAGSV